MDTLHNQDQSALLAVVEPLQDLRIKPFVDLPTDVIIGRIRRRERAIDNDQISTAAAELLAHDADLMPPPWPVWMVVCANFRRTCGKMLR